MNRIPADKLQELDEFVSTIEQGVLPTSKKLAFAGAWRDIDDAIFYDFTNDLISNRQRILIRTVQGSSFQALPQQGEVTGGHH
jgi:hypothetical protein